METADVTLQRRPDLSVIERWIKPGDCVLDLGCGNGALLHYLMQCKQVQGYGLEIDTDNINQCIALSVNVIEQDLDQGLDNFASGSFDVVVMTQALQAVHFPDKVLLEMLRVGQRCIVTFPNFGHWRIRAQLALTGRMPVSKALPYSWYNTPNIHLCTFNDFERLCLQHHIRILDRCVVDSQYEDGRFMRYWPNFFGEIAIYYITLDEAH